MKISSNINIGKPNDFEKTELRSYKKLIGKLIYLLDRVYTSIVFILGLLNRYNIDSKVCLI